mmetsp:Transcript_1624/g.2875  ORF Transcript_1624/g.2875 Transcript_1624/m.2875 type:complete len:221 (-) Transcript_1624:265-927(-)
MRQTFGKPNRYLINQSQLKDQKVEGENRFIKTLEKPITVELMDKMEVGNDTFIYRFALPGRDSGLGHFTCQYLQFEADILNKESGEVDQLTRYYHPMSKVKDAGILDLLIKVYLRNFKFPQGGAFTQFIDTMKEGQLMKVKGIAGDIYYKGHSEFMIRNKETQEMESKRYKRVGMIAAGSGLTPMFQLIQTVADSPSDTTSLSLISSCPTPFDLILDEDL